MTWLSQQLIIAAIPIAATVLRSCGVALAVTGFAVFGPSASAVDRVTVRAHHSAEGYDGQIMAVDVPH